MFRKHNLTPLSKFYLATLILPFLLTCHLQAKSKPQICESCIRTDMNYLASDELRGRGSATKDEARAAQWAAEQFASFGLEPGGDDGYLQRSPLPQPLPAQVAKLLATFEDTPRTETWNVVGILRGTEHTPDNKTKEEAILLSAHIDHMGVSREASGDNIYNGADDDASGTTAVLEIARAMAHGPRPRRTILFVLFGSEELGGFGDHYFLSHPPMPLQQIVSNLEFEMIGRPDPQVQSGYAWLTGWERSNLGAELASHGAHLVADPRPQQHFFERSDNYYLAKQGIVAQTISSFGLHKDYHTPKDDLSGIDFPFMTRTLQSLIDPIRWLANTSWKPEWAAGGQP